MRAAYKSIRLFENPYLEWLSHIHPLTPLFLWGPVAITLFWRGFSRYELPVLPSAGVMLAGLLTWSLAEYLLHRFVFHYRPKNDLQDRIIFIMHGIHHADPVDPTRLVMPPVVSFLLALIFYPLFRKLLGPAWVNPFFGAFIAGYLCYDYIHYAVHHMTPRTALGKALRQSHMTHHYVNHKIRWGVSSPLWDWVFGTLKEPIPVKKPKYAPAAAKGLKRGARGEAKLNRA